MTLEDEIHEIIEDVAVTPIECARVIGTYAGEDVTAFECRRILGNLVSQGRAVTQTHKGVTRYIRPTSGGYDPQGGGAA